MDKRISNVIPLLVFVVWMRATAGLASPGILASAPFKGIGDWDIYLIHPATGEWKQLTDDPGND